MLNVLITDEFEVTRTFVCNNDKEVLKIVKEWLSNRDSTPIYNISIEVNDE